MEIDTMLSELSSWIFFSISQYLLYALSRYDSQLDGSTVLRIISLTSHLKIDPMLDELESWIFFLIPE